MVEIATTVIKATVSNSIFTLVTVAITNVRY